MEVFLAACEASSVLLTVCQLIKKAVEQRKSLAELLQTYGAEVEDTKTLVDLVRNQEPLQTAAVIATIRRVEAIGRALNKHLTHVGKDRGAVKGFAHQLKQGSADQRELDSIMEQLAVAKRNLTVQIQIANVGLTKNVNEAIAINTKLVMEMNEVVQKTLGEERGLNIARFLAELKDRPPEPNGTVRLTDIEYATLETEQIRIAHPEMASVSPDEKRRIICNNLSSDQALHILGPVERDMWYDMAFIKIENNVAMGEAIMVSYPVTMEVFDKLLAARTRGK
ncbi:hypothetical protein DL768_009568 [Monosporascus sp. mg162]|nr:hypothetical protein DL768_009568 [Monosporascus sp. mg162]